MPTEAEVEITVAMLAFPGMDAVRAHRMAVDALAPRIQIGAIRQDVVERLTKMFGAPEKVNYNGLEWDVESYCDNPDGTRTFTLKRASQNPL